MYSGKNEINEKKQLTFFNFIMNIRLSTKFFRGLFSLIIVGGLMVGVFALIDVLNNFNDMTDLGKFRILTSLILALPVILLSIYCLFLRVRRELVYKISLTITFAMVFIFLLPNNPSQFNIFTWAIAAIFIIFIFQSLTMTRSLARKAYAKRGVANYEFLFNQEELKVTVTDSEKIYDQEKDDVIEQVKVRDLNYTYPSIDIVYFYENCIFISIEKNFYFFLDKATLNCSAEELIKFLQEKSIKVQVTPIW